MNNNWVWIVLAVIAVCICISVASSAAEEEKKKTAKAKRPEAFQRLMAEEFPAFASVFTYAKSEEALEAFGKVSARGEVRQHLGMFSNEVKNPTAKLAVGRIYARHIASIYSPDFAEFANENPANFHDGLLRALKSSETIADA
jgi:hypothetical protein